MASIDVSQIQKPVEVVHPDNLPFANEHHFAKALTALVQHSGNHVDVRQNVHASMHHLLQVPWIYSMIPGIQQLAVEHHVGNYVLIRETNERFFESMPIYARWGPYRSIFVVVMDSRI